MQNQNIPTIMKSLTYKQGIHSSQKILQLQ